VTWHALQARTKKPQARLDFSATNQLQLSQAAALQRRDAKIYQNRISYKELLDILH